MDIGQELTTNDDEAASPRRKRPKINGAAEAPPAKRMKSSAETGRLFKLSRVPRTPRASTARTRAAKLGVSKWSTVVPSIAHQVASDLVLVDTKPRLWATNRAELGSAFVEISDSKCVNNISWTLTDMPIVILDNESMVLEKAKDAGNELFMDLVLIREFHYANPNILQKDKDSTVEHSNLSQPKDDSGLVHSLAATPSIIGATPDGLPMGKITPPVPEGGHTPIILSTPAPPPISESKTEEVLQEQKTIPKKPANEALSKIAPQGAPQKELKSIVTPYPDPPPPLLTEIPVSKSKQGRRRQKALQKSVDEPLLKPLQDASQFKELESSGNGSVPIPASAMIHESAILPDISSSNASDTPKRKRGRPRKVQCKPSDESVLDIAQDVSRFKKQEKPADEPPPASTQMLDGAKLSRGKTQQEVSHKSTNQSFFDTAQGVSRSKERGKPANEPLSIPAQIPGHSNSTTTPAPKVKQEEEQQEISPPNGSLDPVQGASRLKEQKELNNQTIPMAAAAPDHTKSLSTASSKPVAGKSMRNTRKALRISTDDCFRRQSDTFSSASRSNARLRSKGEKGKQRRDPEKSVREPLKSGRLPKSEHEGSQRSQTLEKAISKRAISPGPCISTSARTQKSNQGQKQQKAAAREQHPKRTTQAPQKKEPVKSIKSLPNEIARAPPGLWGGVKNPVLASLRFTKTKTTAIDTPIPKVSNTVTEVSQLSLPAPYLAPAPTPAQLAPIIVDAHGPSIEHLHRHSDSETHPRPSIRPTDALLLRSPSSNKYEKIPKDAPIPGTSETLLNALQSFPEERHLHLDKHLFRHYTPDRSMGGQKGRFEPAFGHCTDNRLLPNLDSFPLAFANQHDNPLGVQVEAREVVNIDSRTRNRKDTGCDESQTRKDSAHVDSVESCQRWAARWEPTCDDSNSKKTPTGGLAKHRATRRDIYTDDFVVSHAKYESRMRGVGSDCWDAPPAQMVHRALRRAGRSAWPRAPRAHTYSPVPTSPWTAADFNKCSRSVPYSKPPLLNPHAQVKLQMSNSETVVTGASHNQVVALSNPRNLSPNLQSIGNESGVAAEQTRSSSTATSSSTKDTTMVSLSDEPTPPTLYTQPSQIVAPDGASSEQMLSKPHTLFTPTTPTAGDVTMGSLADERLPPVPIEQRCASTSPPHAPKISASMDISLKFPADKPAPSTPSTQALPPSTVALLPSLKRKGKEKAQAPESSDDESSNVQDEVRQTKKAKLWHDPVVDVSNFLNDLTVPIACSSKTKLEDLLAPESSSFPQMPPQTSAIVIEDHLPPLSISSSPMKPAKRRGRPPKGAKVASSSSSSSKIIMPESARDKLKEHKPPSVSSSVSQSICSSQVSTQVSVMAMQDQLTSSSASVATKPAKRRGRLSQAAKVASSSSAPALSIAPSFTVDELPSISGSLQTGSQTESSTTPAASVRWSEDGVPLPIPAEIQALVDAYINGVPIGVFASSSHLQGFWGLKLKQGEEIGYAFMGFYRVCRVLETLDEGEVYDGENEKGRSGRGKAKVVSEVSKTRVRWRFKLRWEPGGEGWQIRDPQRLTSPWWNSNLKAQELAFMPRTSSEDSDGESTQTYRLARRRNQNFSRRHCYFDQTFCSVLPLHLLAPIDAEIPDAVLPRGWHCPDCGKLNFRYYLRHRRCDSSYCQDKPVGQGYMVELDRLRDPQDGTPLTLPLNNVPGHIRANTRIHVWNDRMKTLIYCFQTGIVGGMARVQHIFTCNLSDLQRVPSELFNSIQMDVPLRRPAGDAYASPYFVHSVGDGSGKAGDSSSWITAPQCLHRAKEVMNNRGRKYGKKTAAELDINNLLIRAWVTSGSKRGSDLLQAKERCIVVMCLGCEVILSISPKSAMPPNDNQTRLPDLDKLIPMESLDPQEDHLTKPEPRESVKLDLGEKESQPHLVSAPSTMTEVMKKNQKGEKVEMTLSLLHGDAVLLEGDDFEYSIKRTGTSILLFGL